MGPISDRSDLRPSKEEPRFLYLFWLILELTESKNRPQDKLTFSCFLISKKHNFKISTQLKDIADTAGFEGLYFRTVSMIYYKVDPISLNEDITGHLSPIFYPIWDYGLVGISWSDVVRFIMLLDLIPHIIPFLLEGFTKSF